MFHRTWDVDIQSIVEFLQLIQDCLTYDTTVISFVTYFPQFTLPLDFRSRMVFALRSSSCTDDRTSGSIPVQLKSFRVFNVKHINPIVCAISSSFAFRNFHNYNFKPFSRVKLTRDLKVCFIYSLKKKGMKIAQLELILTRFLW